MNEKLNKNILIVEDESAVAMALSLLLEKKGYQVRVAMNGQQGLDLLGEKVPDLLVTDIKMPVMSGTDMIKRIRSEGILSELEILVITTSPYLLEEAEINDVKVLRKPIGFVEAVEAIESMVQCL